MADRRRVLTITADTAKAGWERPDDLWRRVSLLRRVRLRRTIAKHVLPVLQQLESLYLRDHLGASPRLVGKSISQIEADDIAIEAGLYLFDLALSEGLIVFDGNDSPPDESKPAGSWGCPGSGTRAPFPHRRRGRNRPSSIPREAPGTP